MRMSERDNELHELRRRLQGPSGTSVGPLTGQNWMEEVHGGDDFKGVLSDTGDASS